MSIALSRIEISSLHQANDAVGDSVESAHAPDAPMSRDVSGNNDSDIETIPNNQDHRSIVDSIISEERIKTIPHLHSDTVEGALVQPLDEIDTAEDRLEKEGVQKYGKGYQNVVARAPSLTNRGLKARYREIGMLQTALVPDALSMRVPYLNSEEREQYRLSVSNGVLRDSAGNPLDTAGENHLIVMDRVGRIYSGPRTEVKHHSSFLAGNPVAAAGLIQAEHGKVNRLMNYSGHYQTSGAYFTQLEKELKRQGLKMTPNATEGTPPRLFPRRIVQTLKRQLRNKPEIVEHSSSAKDPISNEPIPTAKHKPGQVQRLYPTKPRWEWP